MDIYQKTLDEFKVKTFSGGIVSLVALVIIVMLTISEFLFYLEIQRTDAILLDNSEDANQKIAIRLDITFPHISCPALNIDIMDVSGEHQKDVENFFYKTRLNQDTLVAIDKARLGKLKDEEYREKREKNLVMSQKVLEEEKKKEREGDNYCGSCYTGEKDRCCNTCAEVKAAYRRKNWKLKITENIVQCWKEEQEKNYDYSMKEGCRLNGSFMVKKVPGNFHFAPGESHNAYQEHGHDYTNFQINHFNTSHIINNLGFGIDYPGMKNPLDRTQKSTESGIALYQYFIKVVPTRFKDKKGKKIQTNQYSVTEHERVRDKKGNSQVAPGVYFIYDLSPILVDIKEERKSFFTFITSLCAIVGGVFTVSGIIDGILYHFQKKKQENKNLL